MPNARPMPMPGESHRASGSARPERLPRAFDNFGADSPDVPMGSRSVEASPPVGSRSLMDFSHPNRTNQHASTLDECEIRRHDEF